MKKVVLLSIFILSSPALLLAQDTTQNGSFFQKVLDYFNPNKPRTFNNEDMQINIKWDSVMKYQIIFTNIPDRLTHYLDLSYAEPYDGSIKIIFLDKDGIKIDEESLYLKQDCTTKDGILTCGASAFVIDQIKYRKITSATVSIN